MVRLFKTSSLIFASVIAASAAGVDFQRDIQAMFAEHCYECHGPDKQKGGLNFTTREGAMKVLESGAAAVVPGHAEKSEALARMLTHDEEDMMPPKKKTKRPTKDQIELFRKWIASGAEWTEHWAYKPVVRPTVPKMSAQCSVLSAQSKYGAPGEKLSTEH